MSQTKRIIFSAACIALCVVLPIAFHAIPGGGSLFSPMHIPVFLCGLICGPFYGLLCGILGPLLSSVIIQMPAMAYLPVMMCELAAYGLFCGLLMAFLSIRKRVAKVYVSLAVSMLLGRIVGGAMQALVFSAGAYGISAWVSGYILGTLPAIAIHLILVPAVYLSLWRAGLLNKKK